MKKTLTTVLLLGIALFALLVSLKQPSNDREWTPDLQRLAGVSLLEEGGVTYVQLSNVRDSTYENGEEVISYYSAKYNIDEIERVWFLVEPFSKWKAAAHTFFVFDFVDGQTLAFSVEARKEADERYSALRGLFREYETYYLFGSERDLILRRTDFLDHEVYMYPIETTRENLRMLFSSIIDKARSLETEPEFYNTITDSCTTTLVDHVNSVSPGKVSWWRVEQYLPGLSDELAYKLGLIDNTLPFGETKERASIQGLANKCAANDNFSQCLRAGLEARK